MTIRDPKTGRFVKKQPRVLYRDTKTGQFISKPKAKLIDIK